MERVVRQWKRLPREVTESPSTNWAHVALGGSVAMMGCGWSLDLMILEPFPTLIIPLFSPDFTWFLFSPSPFIFLFAMPHLCPVVSLYRLFIYSLGNFGYHDEFYFSCQAVRFNPNLSVGAWTRMNLGSFIPRPSFHHSFLHQPRRGHPLIPITPTLQTQKLKRTGEK